MNTFQGIETRGMQDQLPKERTRIKKILKPRTYSNAHGQASKT